jgi:hypothetical protein
MKGKNQTRTTDSSIPRQAFIVMTHDKSDVIIFLIWNVICETDKWSTSRGDRCLSNYKFTKTRQELTSVDSFGLKNHEREQRVFLEEETWTYFEENSTSSSAIRSSILIWIKRLPILSLFSIYMAFYLSRSLLHLKKMTFTHLNSEYPTVSSFFITLFPRIDVSWHSMDTTSWKNLLCNWSPDSKVISAGRPSQSLRMIGFVQVAGVT